MSWKGIKIILLVTYSITLISRAFQALYFDLPIETWLWDQNLLEVPAIKFFGSWSNYLSVINEQFILRVQFFIGFIWLSSAFLIWFDKYWAKFRFLFILSTFLYGVFVLSEGKEQFYRIGQYLEFGLQLWIVGLMCFSPYFRMRRISQTVPIFTAFTFFAHGLYAINYYPRPGYFVQMTMNVLSVKEDLAISFLWIVGAIDLVIAILLLIPKVVRKYAFIYCVLWGFLTTLARLWAHFDLVNFDSYLYRWGFEFGVRIVHFSGPLIAYCLLIKKDKLVL